jgi:quinol monooxygenase YgiN
MSLATPSGKSSSTTSITTTTNAATPLRPFAVNVELHLLPERRDEFIKIITYDAKQTMETETGSLQFTIGTNTLDRNKFHLHEQYRTSQDFDVHCATSHFQMWKDFCETQPFVSDPIVQLYQCCSDRVHHDHPPPDSTGSSTPSTTYCLNVELCIRPEVRDEFLTVIENNQIGSRSTKEPFCIQYDYGESISTPNHFYFHEQYIGNENGKEGFDQHTQSDHFKRWEEFVAATNPFTKEPVVSFFESIPY